jgi:hypothetical protein
MTNKSSNDVAQLEGIAKAHADFLSAMCIPPHPIGTDGHSVDINQRGLYLTLFLSAAKIFATALIEEASVNDTSREIADADLDLAVDAHFHDLAGDIGGTFSRAADAIGGQPYSGMRERGPMVKREWWR